MKKQKLLGRKTVLLISLTLFAVSVWETSVRMDAMYRPIKMFFSMAIGEKIPFSAAMKYFDYSIFESPLWLLGCMLVSLSAVALSRRPLGQGLILPAAGALAVYGLMRESSFFMGPWPLVQPALLLALACISAVNLILYPFRRKKHESEPMDAPRMADAPRLRKTARHSSRRKSA